MINKIYRYNSLFGFSYLRPIHSLKMLWQRATRGWADVDAPFMNLYMVNVLVPMLDSVKDIRKKAIKEYYLNEETVERMCREIDERYGMMQRGLKAGFFVATEGGSTNIEDSAARKNLTKGFIAMATWFRELGT